MKEKLTLSVYDRLKKGIKAFRNPTMELTQKSELTSKAYWDTIIKSGSFGADGKASDAKNLLQSMEERITYVIGKTRLFNLYSKLDGLTFNNVNKMVSKIVGPGFSFKGATADDVKSLQEWADIVYLKRPLKEAIRDMYLTGIGWGELVPNAGYDDIVMVRPLNATTMDFERNAENQVILDDMGLPRGIVRTVKNKKIYWYENRIQVNDEVTEKLDDQKFFSDFRDRIYWLRLYSIAETMLAITPMQLSYPDVIRKLNIADAIAENAFRTSGIVATIEETEGELPPAGLVENVMGQLMNAQKRTIFVFPSRVSLGPLKMADMRDMQFHLDYFVDAQCQPYGIPKELQSSARLRAYGREVDIKARDFEVDVKSLQEDFADEVCNQIIKVVAKGRKLTAPYPRLIFNQNAPLMALSQSRRVATMARPGLIINDLELEIHLRKNEGLPTTYLEMELERLNVLKATDPKKALEEYWEVTRRIIASRRPKIGEGEEATIRKNEDE